MRQRQDRLAEQRDAVARIARRIVAVGGLGAIDVPVGDRVARVPRGDHRLQRGAHHGAAGFAAVEEFLLVDLRRFVRVTDEDDVDTLVFPFQEEVQQDEEALGEILLALAHRGRDVHEAEHDCLCARHDNRVEAIVADVDRIDERYGALPALHAPDLGVELADPQLIGDFRPRLGAQRRELRLQPLELGQARATKREPPAHADPHRAQHGEVRRRAVAGVSRAAELAGGCVLERGLDEVGKLEVLEQDVEEFGFAEREGERILAAA